MKLPTLDEYLEQRKLERQRERDRKLELAREELDSIDPNLAPLHTGPDADQRRATLRHAISLGQCDPLPLCCNHCRTRLWNPEPGLLLMSSPPKERVACPGCGWSGYL